MTTRSIIKELFPLIDNMLGEEKEAIRKRYKIPIDIYEFNASKHNSVVREAARLAMRVMRGGGAPEEVRMALTYLFVCFDAQEYYLDYLQCETECDIQRMKLKYGDVKID